MNKSIQKVLAFVTVLVMIVSLLPVITVPAFASIKTPAADMVLDYDALFEDAYIVWPSGATTVGSSWTFNFRGATKTVPYSADRCFKSFSAAVSAFNKKGAEAVVTETPVFVIVTHKTATTKISLASTLYGNAIILGANAGISPNATIDVANQQKTDPTAKWEASSSRGTETLVTGTITHGNTETYDAAAKAAGVKQYNIIIDGLKLQDQTASFVSNKCSEQNSTQAKEINLSVRNTILDFNSTTVVGFASTDEINTFNLDLKNIRMGSGVGNNTYSKHKALFDNHAANVTIDGMFYDNNAYTICNTLSYTTDQIDIVPEEFSFTMKNSIIHGNTSGLRMTMFGLAEKSVELTFQNNIFYECGYKWGIMTFKSSSDWNNSSTSVNFDKNTVIVGKSGGDYFTLFEGGDSLKGPITLNVTNNRIIGYDSMFPTVGTYPLNYLGTLHGICAYNYFAPSFSSVNDTAGVAPVWYGSAPDHYHFNSAIYNGGEYTYSDASNYYTDYQMTSKSDRFDIVETDFFDDLDYISINNANRIVRLRVSNGLTVSGLSKNYGFKFRGGTPSAVTFSSTSVSSSSTSSFTMKVTMNGSSVTYTIYPEAQTSAVSYTNLDTNDGTGTFSDSRLYLYSPSGATTATIGGITYDFSGRSYKTIAEIFTAAGSWTSPQIIIPAGTYDAITLTKQCEIYGESWDSPATGGTGADVRLPGSDWTRGKETIIKGITLSSGVASSYQTNTVSVAGIVLTGAFTDTARAYGINLTFKNSVINGGYFNLQNTGTTAKTAGGFTVSGVKVNSVGTTDKKLISSNMPYKTTLENVEIAGEGIVLGGTWASGLSGSACALTVNGCYFNQSANNVIGNVTNGSTFSSSTITINDSAFVVNATGRQTPSLLGIDIAKLKSVSVTNNWFVNSGDAYHTVFGDVSGTATFTSNRLIGMDIGGSSSSKNNNYYAPYTYDFKTVANGRVYGSGYYIDPELKVKGTEFKISSVSGGSASISENLRTVYVKGTGAVTLTFTNSIPYTVYSDAACTTPATLSGEGIYYVKATYKDVTRVYTVRIDGGDELDFNDTFVNDIIGSSGVVFATTAITPDNYGERVNFTFDRAEYSFVAGINAFASVADALAYTTEHGVSDPKVILGEYGEQLSIPAKAKIYGGNYNTVPYVKTENADLDWTYNEVYDENKTTVTNIVIGPEATGYMEVNGVEMTGFYRDITRVYSKPLSVKISNILVNKTNTDNRALFDLDGQNAKNAANTESFTAEDVYIQSASKTRLLYEFYPSKLTFDGLYLDCNTFTMNTINYVKNSGTSTELTIKNSNLRNYAPTSNFAFLFQGDDTALESGESKILTLDNNVLYNFSFGATALIPLQPNKLSDIVLTNNKVLSKNKSYGLFYNYSNVANTSLRLDIEDNLLLGVNPTASMGSAATLNTSSVIARNHTAATYSTEVSGTAIKVTGANTITETVYALDDTMSPLYMTDFVYKNVTSKDNAIYEKTLSSNTLTLKIEDGYDAADFDWVFANDKITAKFYSNSSCTTTVDASKVTKGSTYYMRPTFVGDDGKVWQGDVYTILLTDTTTSYPLFNHSVISDDAILVDSTVNTSAQYHNTDWDGKTYSFVVGENVFATLDAAIAKGGKDASYIIKDINGSNEITNWNITTPGKYYTQNFDKTPYIATDKAEDPDGSDWTANVNTGKAGSFESSKGIKVKNLVLNTATAGSYEFHGFEITNSIQDDDYLATARTNANDINVLINNVYINKIYADSGVINLRTHFMLDSSGNNLGDTAKEFDDSVTLKNVYYTNTTTKDLFASDSTHSDDYKYNVNLWAEFTIDGMFADYSSFNVADETMYLGAYGDKYSFTIKNSNLRNRCGTYDMLFFEGHNGYGVDYGYDAIRTRSLIFEDNIFYNFTFGKNTRFLCYKNGFFNELVFDGNYLYGVADNMALTDGNYGNDVHPDTYVTITNNSFMGINPNYSFNRWVTWEYTSVKDNYCVATRPADTSVVSYGGVKFVMTVNNWKYDTDGTTKVYYQTNGHYWLDSERKLSPDEVAPMYLSNGKVLDSTTPTQTLEVDYSVTTLNLNDILTNPGNIIVGVFVDGIEADDITALDVAEAATIELEITSSTGVGDIQYRSIVLEHTTSAKIDTISATLFNGINFNFKTTGLTGGEYMTFEIAGKTITKQPSYKSGIYTVFSISDFAPHLMTEVVTAKLIKDDVVIDTAYVSFEEYCANLYLDYFDDEELYNLCIAILNYGAQAQLYKNYNTDYLANDVLAPSEKTITAPTMTNVINTAYEKVTSAKATWKSHAVILDDAIEMKLGFTAIAPVKDMSVIVVDEDGYERAEITDIWFEDGKYQFIFDDFSLTEADNVFYFKIMSADKQVSNTLAYSVESYAAAAQSNSSVKTLAQALVRYTQAAEIYELA